MGVTATLSAFAADIRLDALPPEVVNRARFLVLDLVGNIVRARYEPKAPRHSSRQPERWGWPLGIPACSATRRATLRPGRLF